MSFVTISRDRIVIPNKLQRKLDIKEGSKFIITEMNGTIILKKIDHRHNQKCVKTLKSISETWKEIESSKCGRGKVSKFFAEFSKW